MKFKKFLSLTMVAVLTLSLVGCGSKDEKKDEAAVSKKVEDMDLEKLKGTTVSVYTHSGNRVLGEEKKDEAGNTYRDESSAYLKFLADRFTEKYGIKVELNVITNEDELRPLFQVKDSSVDVFTSPNWSLEEWKNYSEA